MPVRHAKTVGCLGIGLLTLATQGCTHTENRPADDPLHHTKKLVIEGHRSLYHNGAFQVPNTTIKLIPPWPTVKQWAAEVMGIGARQSFLESLARARDSVQIVAEGTRISAKAASGIHEATQQVTDEIRSYTREESILLLERASQRGRAIIGKSWDFSQETAKDLARYGLDLRTGAQEAGQHLSESGSEAGARLGRDARARASQMAHAARGRSSQEMTQALQSFTRGYAAVPTQLAKQAQTVGDTFETIDMVGALQKENARRAQWSQVMTDLAGKVIRDYGDHVRKDFHEAHAELKQYQTTGVSLATLKSLRWVLQGVFWDAMVEPAAKLTGASLGYIGVNSMVFPVMVTIREGVAVTELAAQVSWSATKMAYELTAPTIKATLGSLFGLVDFAGSNLTAGAVAGGGSLVGLVEQGGSKVAAVTVKTAGLAAGTTVQYLGVPLSAAGIAVGGGTLGVAIGSAQAVGGGALLVGGEVASAGTYGAGTLVAGTALVGGTAASAAVAAGYGYYQVNRAVIVPTAYELAGGMVLGYSANSQIQAHAVLAVADFSYLVLSLEGPRWVVYAVKGKLGKGEDLAPGTMLDLKRMQEAGEEFAVVPLTKEEIDKVVESAPQDLPDVE